MTTLDGDVALWDAIEDGYDARVEARTLFNAAFIAHEHAMNEMMRAERAVEAARTRAEASRTHGVRAGVLLVDAIRLMEARGAR